MDKLIFVYVMVIALGGCSDNLKITTMSEIQKMDNVIEISWWSCDEVNKSKECVHYKLETGTSEKQKIAMFMSAVKEIKTIPQRKCDDTDIVCFKDEHGKMLCTNMNPLNDKIVYGSDYEDSTGMLYKAVTTALLAPLVGYKDYDLANFDIATMAEIQKINNVEEITLWDCEKWKDGNECTSIAYWDSTSDKQKISEFMSVIRELIIEPNRGSMYGRLICFKDNTGRVMCTNIEPLDDKTFYGSDYKDATGKLSEALQVAMAGCEDKSKPCPATIEDIQKMKDIVEISLWSFNSLKNQNEYIDQKKLKTTTDEKKIALIMSVVNDIETGSYISPPAPFLNLICFKNKGGEILCTSISYGKDSEISGSNYIDTGKLENALQSAGFPLLKPREPNRKPSGH